ncbi:hypothetical protein EYF80_036890 [Liparis tanakae]|uniref:Uncharacterized protein n=1 Tax=Liparis tanakae TaxID=230148 RepID=A0A4Z2GH59_9TELE|nr:hypothetical protein EYF80_036890 [Liparis tanakae]
MGGGEEEEEAESLRGMRATSCGRSATRDAGRRPPSLNRGRSRLQAWVMEGRRAPRPALWKALMSASLAEWYSVATCLASWYELGFSTLIHRMEDSCRGTEERHRREARPMSSLPVVALITSRVWSPTVQFTLKLGALPGCRASALLIPGEKDEKIF